MKLQTIRSVHGWLNVLLGGIIISRIKQTDTWFVIETLQGLETPRFASEADALLRLKELLAGSLSQIHM